MNSLDSSFDYPGVAGKCYLVTGASSGIGKATAILLSRLGAQVIITGRNEERLAETHAQLAGTKHVVVAADLREVEMLSWLKGLITKAEAPLAGVAHCAGTAEFRPLRIYSAEALMQTLAEYTVISSTLFHASCRLKNKELSLSLVAMSSISSHIGYSGNAFYAAARAALESLVRNFAVEYSKYNIRCNSIVAGHIAGTGMADALFEALGPEAISKFKGQYPLGLGSPDDAANLFAFLLGSASRWITGAAISLDGGCNTSRG